MKAWGGRNARLVALRRQPRGFNSRAREGRDKSAFAARMGQGKTKTLQVGLQDFCFFLPIPA